jgi:hypothetical protein
MGLGTVHPLLCANRHQPTASTVEHRHLLSAGRGACGRADDLCPVEYR